MPARLFVLVYLLLLSAPVASVMGQQREASGYAELQTRSGPYEVQPAAALSVSEDSEPLRATAEPRSSSGIALPARDRSEGSQAEGSASRRSPIFTVISGLTIVIGLFALVAWAAKKSMPKASAPLPSDIVQVLGRAPLAHRQNMHLVRIGRKLLLVCATPHGAETLTEIVDPAEVEQICAVCERNRPGSISATFRQVLAQVGNERTAPGFLGAETPATRPLKVRTSP